jgi:hypothetical protein
MNRHRVLLIRYMLTLALALTGMGGMFSARASGELVAALESLSGTVSVKRFDAGDYTQVNGETLVGVGDTVRTAANSRARITFFSNGVETDILPESEFRIDAFTGDEKSFEIAVTVLIGQTAQRVTRLLDANSRYTINSTGLILAVRGTEFAVRVEASGRSATIVQAGLVKAENPGTAGLADVPAGFGVRAEAAKGLSDVVRAATFAQLDAALDGCNAVIKTEGDVVLNVRTGPDLSFTKIGTLDNFTRQRVLGVTETTKWYRIPYLGWFAWVFAPALELDKACAGLRRYPDNQPAEEISRYPGLTPVPTPGR